MKDVNELLAMEDRTITNDDLAPHLSGRHPGAVPGKRAPLERAFNSAYEAVQRLQGNDPFTARARAHAASIRHQLRAILAEVSKPLPAPWDQREEADRTERAWLRQVLEGTRVMRAIPAARPARPGAPGNLPALRVIGREPPVRMEPIGKPTWQPAAWCHKHRAVLLDPSPVRVDNAADGRKRLLVAHGVPAEIRAVLDARTGDVVAWIENAWDEAGPVPGLVLDHVAAAAPLTAS